MSINTTTNLVRVAIGHCIEFYTMLLTILKQSPSIELNIAIHHSSTYQSICVCACAGFLLRAGTRVIYPAMTLHVPGYRPDGRSFFSVTSQ